jgi:hypothetical protein
LDILHGRQGVDLLAKALAFFSFVCPHVLDTHPRITLFTAYVPILNTHIAKYLAPVFNVAHPSTNPKTAILFAIVICHVLSLNRPELHDHNTLMNPAMR